MAVILGSVGAYLLALALVGFSSNLLPDSRFLPIFFVAAAGLLFYEAWVFWRGKQAAHPLLPRSGAVSTLARRPPRSWAEARRRFLRVCAIALPALTAVGVGVGLSLGSMIAAVWLGVLFSLVGVAWFVVVYRVGRRQWGDSRRGP